MTDGRPDERFDEETRALLQTRLMAVLGVLSLVACFYALSHVVLGLLPSRERQSSPLVPLLTFAIGVSLGLVALRCRSGRRSSVELRTLDTLATALTCWVIAGSLTDVSPRNEASISIVLGTTYVLMARAVFLPSSGWRTLGIGALSLVPAGLVATRLRLEAFGLLERFDEWPLQASLVFRNLGVTGFLASLTSHVIYGLRQKVRENARLGQYLLREKIGEGGMGVVYRATHAMLRRDTAVKVLLPSRVSELGVMRFEREVKLTAQLKHPSTVAIFDYGRTPDGVFYYAMEYLEGGDLERLLEYAGRLPPARAVFILDQLCRALAEAHALGLIHRDIKPSNVLLGERGGEGDAAKILDFGLVKNLHAEEDAARTRDDALTGTPLYLSPESISDLPPAEASEVIKRRLAAAQLEDALQREHVPAVPGQGDVAARIQAQHVERVIRAERRESAPKVQAGDAARRGVERARSRVPERAHPELHRLAAVAALDRAAVEQTPVLHLRQLHRLQAQARPHVERVDEAPAGAQLELEEVGGVGLGVVAIGVRADAVKRVWKTRPTQRATEVHLVAQQEDIGRDQRRELAAHAGGTRKRHLRLAQARAGRRLVTEDRRAADQEARLGLVGGQHEGHDAPAALGAALHTASGRVPFGRDVRAGSGARVGGARFLAIVDLRRASGHDREQPRDRGGETQ